MIVECGGKVYIREGYCCRCGECCAAGWPHPCPHLRLDKADLTTSCAIYDRRADRDDPEALRVCGVHTTACARFPAEPGDIMNQVGVRNRCTYQFIEVGKVLVACSTFDGKGYCLDRWLEATRALDYPAFEIMMVDNSDTDAYATELRRRGVNVIRENWEGWPEKRIAESNEVIRQRFLMGTWKWWLNLESDVIAPPETLRLLVRTAENLQADWTGICYRSRDGQTCASSFGCSLFSRRIMEETTFGGIPHGESVDGWWWGHIVKPQQRFRTVELYDFLGVVHA